MTSRPSLESTAPQEKVSLEREMKRLKSATRRLKKKFRREDVKAADVLDDLRLCQNALMKTKVTLPHNLQGEKNQARRAEYAAIMIDCLIACLKSEQAAVRGDMKKAASFFKDMMRQQKKGHDKFRE